MTPEEIKTKLTPREVRLHNGTLLITESIDENCPGVCIRYVKDGEKIADDIQSLGWDLVGGTRINISQQRNEDINVFVYNNPGMTYLVHGLQAKVFKGINNACSDGEFDQQILENYFEKNQNQ